MCAGKTNNKRRNNIVTVVTASTMQYLTQHPNTHEEGIVLKVCRWSIAAGKRPVPFRTRKLSLHTLMVLQPGGCGIVSHRRHQTTKTTKYSNDEAVEDSAPLSAKASTASFVVLPRLSVRPS